MAPITAAKHSTDISSPPARLPRTKSQMSASSRTYRRESRRLRTFANWPVAFLRATDLAKNGFYFTNIGDVVRCAFCKIQIGFWEEDDDPVKEHTKLAPGCPLLKNEPCGNVPLSEDALEEEDEPSAQDVCGVYSMDTKPLTEPERSNALPMYSENLWRDFSELEVSEIHEPVAPLYATYAVRIKTFDKWKSHDVQVPEKLAEAGFYCIGDDSVLCFHCGGGLKSWEKGDDPWIEHARWFSKCHFVFLQRGKDFVNEVIRKKESYLTSTMAQEIFNTTKKCPVVNATQTIQTG